MYRKILITLLVVLIAVIALELARPRHAPRAVARPVPSTAESLLRRRIPELKLRNLTVEQAIDTIRTTVHVPILVNWDGMTSLRYATIDVQLRDVALADALRIIFTPISAGEPVRCDWGGVDFDVLNGTLIVTTAPTFPVMRVQIYDVHDLITDAYWGVESGPRPAEVQANRLTDLSNLVRDSLSMYNWEQGPGSHGAGELSGRAASWGSAGRLFVGQTEEGQRKVAILLEQLRRQGTGNVFPSGRPVDSRPNLDMMIGDADFESVPLAQVLEQLASLGRVNLVPDWPQLKELGFTRQTPISLHVRDVQLDVALSALAAASTHDDRQTIGFGAADGVVIVTARDDATSSAQLNDVRDLLGRSLDPPPGDLGRDPLYDSPYTAGVRRDLHALRNAVNAATGGQIDYSWGLFLVSLGRPTENRRVRDVLAAIRHPVSISKPRGDIWGERTLRRPIGGLEMSNVPARQALASFARAAGPNVVFEGTIDEYISNDDLASAPPITLHLQNPTLEEALNAILPTFTDLDPALAYWEEDGVVHVGEADNGGMARAYDVRPLLNATPQAIGSAGAASVSNSPATSEQNEKALVEQIASQLAGLGLVGNTSPHLGCWNGILVAVGSARLHRDIEFYLRTLLRTGKPPVRP